MLQVTLILDPGTREVVGPNPEESSQTLDDNEKKDLR